jgi:GTP cyclohydrolase II
MPTTTRLRHVRTCAGAGNPRNAPFLLFKFCQYRIHSQNKLYNATSQKGAPLQPHFAHTTEDIKLPTHFGDFLLKVYVDDKEKEHLVALMGDIDKMKNPLVRLHSECITGDVFGSMRCDCGEQLNGSMELISKAKEGIIIYLRQEGRGIGLTNKLRAYKLQDEGHDTVEANLMLGHKADERDFSIAAHILNDLGIKGVRLITNNPDKLTALEQHGIPAERVELKIKANEKNAKYLKVKAAKLRHYINFS